MRWNKTGQKWLAVEGPYRCEVTAPLNPDQPIERYSWSMRAGRQSVSGATSSLAESKLAAEQEVQILKDRGEIK
jgi:hypothetical protein